MIGIFETPIQKSARFLLVVKSVISLDVCARGFFV
ncbi:hypothetical protein T07_13596 [Trichinella nelsoni]|uniref:Uncharacterized protein n=1 Tax=Trichinella nelsoni TaxID=6336 RepID=A0A0V0RDF9_9BILA|nr:hypothetical protein T07_13596 [Trichinella nelsoni]